VQAPVFAPDSVQASAPQGERLLTLQGVSAGCDGSRILSDVDFAVDDRQVVGLLGRNGVGKTTLLYTIMGAVP